MPYKLRVPEDTVDLIRGLHPLLKKRVKAAIKLIIAEPHSGKALKQELKGLWSFRVRKIRIIYRITGKKYIDIIAIGPRKNIYEETYRIIRK
jgi:mRNA interferase RelE/StbE